MSRIHIVLVLCLLAAGTMLTAGGCSRFGPIEGAERVAQADPEMSPEALSNQLRDIVTQRVERERRSGEAARNHLVRKKPYYYKEYADYPGEPPQVEVDLRESESRAAPYVAQASVDKVRYATRMHRRQDTARADDNFLREVGTETLTYELRGGYWTWVGSLFVADKTEEYVNGEWVPTREEVMRTVATEERRGWWGRAWSGITNIF